MHHQTAIILTLGTEWLKMSSWILTLKAPLICQKIDKFFVCRAFGTRPKWCMKMDYLKALFKKHSEKWQSSLNQVMQLLKVLAKNNELHDNFTRFCKIFYHKWSFKGSLFLNCFYSKVYLQADWLSFLLSFR